MITRDQALEFLNQQIENENIKKHMYATEAIMRALARYFLDQGKIQPRPGQTAEQLIEEWGLAGLLHDADYTPDTPPSQQGVKVSRLLEEAGYQISEEMKHCMAAHNSETGVKPQSLMDWSLFCCDSLTGLIVATTLVHPDKKLSSIKVKSVLKKFKDKAFARGTRREDIAMCETQLGIPLPDFVELSLKAMQGIASDLGL